MIDKSTACYIKHVPPGTAVDHQYPYLAYKPGRDRCHVEARVTGARIQAADKLAIGREGQYRLTCPIGNENVSILPDIELINYGDYHFICIGKYYRCLMFEQLL